MPKLPDDHPIEWSIVRGDVLPLYELHMRNLTEQELAVAAQVVAALQRQRQRRIETQAQENGA